jgi:hypothetical protein
MRIDIQYHRYVIGVRVQGDSKYINKIETLVSDQGDWLFNATGTAYYNALETWGAIPVEHRDTREVIQAAGDAYFDRFGNINITVPFGADYLSRFSSQANTPKARHALVSKADPTPTHASPTRRHALWVSHQPSTWLIGGMS